MRATYDFNQSINIVKENIYISIAKGNQNNLLETSNAKVILHNPFTNKMQTNIKNIDEYILTFPKDIRILLETTRATIQKAAPNASETIKYGMPTFVLEGNLVHFAANKQHLGFYPTPSGILAFSEELESYITTKGAIQFPYNKKIPFALIAKIVKYRVKENLEKAEAKKRK